MDRQQQWAAYKFAILMAVLGVALGGLALWLFLITPAADQYVAPSFTRVSVSSTVKVSAVRYRIFRPEPPVHEQISVQLDAASPSARGSAVVQISLPHGKTFRSCPACGTSSSKAARFVHGKARYQWTVNHTRLAWVINLDTADAVLPQLTYTGPGNPLFNVDYVGIINAYSYDWNTMATSLIQKDQVAWTVPTIDGYAQAEVATGVNHRVDHILASNGFITGALVGAGAGGLLAAIQAAHQVSSDRNRSEDGGQGPGPPYADPSPGDTGAAE
jgi:hypothetical protein